MNYILEQIKTKLEEGLVATGKVSTVFIGEPKLLSKEESDRGFIYLKPISDETVLVQTQHDQGLYEIEVVVLRDVRKDWNTDGDHKNPTKWLMDIVQDALPDGTLQTDTVKYILRNNLTTIGKTHDMTITYDVRERKESYVYEARITLSILTLRGRTS